MRETSQSLAQSVFQQLSDQLGYTDPHLSRGVRSPMAVPVPLHGGQPVPQQQPEQVLILR